MSLNTVQLFLALIVFGSLAVACSYNVDSETVDKPSPTEHFIADVTGETAYARLSSYNDRWDGEVTLNDGRVVSIRTEILVPHASEDDSRKEQKRKDAFALFGEGEGVVGARTEITHKNTLRVGDAEGDYLQSREFIFIEMTSNRFHGPDAGAERHLLAVRAVGQQMGFAGQEAKLDLGQLKIQLRGERHGSRIEGKVFGFDWVTGVYFETGKFVLRRSAPTSSMTMMNSREIWTQHYTFRYFPGQVTVVPN